jgi:hypothetical protein
MSMRPMRYRKLFRTRSQSTTSTPSSPARKRAARSSSAI